MANGKYKTEKDLVNSTITIDISQINKRLTNLENELTKEGKAIAMITKVTGSKMESYAKRNRPWTDRTGDARRRLTGGYYRDNEGFVSYISHQVPYGIYLETRNYGSPVKMGENNEGTYAILRPTIRAIEPELRKSLNKLIERLNI